MYMIPKNLTCCSPVLCHVCGCIQPASSLSYHYAFPLLRLSGASNKCFQRNLKFPSIDPTRRDYTLQYKQRANMKLSIEPQVMKPGISSKLQLFRKPLLGNGNSILNFIRIGTLTSSGWLFATRSASQNFRYRSSPVLSSDSL